MANTPSEEVEYSHIKRLRDVHWIAPTTIFGALLCGILFALANHVFNSTLSGHPVPSYHLSVVGTQVSRQELNIVAGTTFAAIIKLCLGLALSTSYAQLFWHATAGRQTKLIALDALGAVTTNALHLFRIPIWLRYPLLLLVALLTW